MVYKNKEELKNAILSLKTRQLLELDILKEEFEVSVDSINLLSVLKCSLQEFVDKHSIKGNMLEIALAIGANLFIEKMKPKPSTNKLTLLIVSFLEFSLRKYLGKK